MQKININGVIYVKSYSLCHFLVVNHTANEVINTMGLKAQNFAKLVFDEAERGAFANSQMTKFFWAIDRAMSDANNCEDGQIFEHIENENDLTIEDIAALSLQDLEALFDAFVRGYLTVK